MEDLATLEISRSQTWQWLRHNVTLDNGSQVCRELISNLFNEELEKIYNEVDLQMKDSNETDKQTVKEEFNLAKRQAEELYLQENLPDFLTTESPK